MLARVYAEKLQQRWGQSVIVDARPGASGGPMMVARANAPYSNISEFVELAKRQPKPLSYGTWGTGSSAHLFTELLQRQSSIKVLHAPYKAEAAMHNDLFGDSLDFAWTNP